MRCPGICMVMAWIPPEYRFGNPIVMGFLPYSFCLFSSLFAKLESFLQVACYGEWKTRSTAQSDYNKEIDMKKIAIMLCLLSAVLIAHADTLWPDAVAIRQGVNIEWFRTGIETNDGGAVYVWSDTKLGERDLWAQKVDASGNMVWGDPVLVDGKPDRQEDPVVTRTSDNNYIMAWVDFSSDLDGDIYAQKISAQGQIMWQTGGIAVCTANDVQISLNIEADNNGGAFIVWVDSRNPSKDLYGQRLSGTGVPLWDANGEIIANGAGDEIQNTMLPDGEGGMIIAYTHTYVGADDIYAKRFDANGNMVWANPLNLAVADGNQNGVRMAAMTGGEFIFTWQDQRNLDPDIYAQKINLAGQTQWGNYMVVFSDQGQPSPVSQTDPRIVKTSDNGVIIIWEDYRLDTQNPDLFAQKITISGTKAWTPDGVALCTAEFGQSGPRMSSDGAGGCYVVWDDLRNGNSPNDDIYAQHLSSTGASLWEANGKPICTAPNQQNGSLVKVSNNNVFINWMDVRNGSVGIYYQVLNSTGATLLENNGHLVFWGLSGDTPKDNYLILNRSNDIAIIWQDTRFANDGYRIYMQFLNPDGTVDLETNGRPVTIGVNGSQQEPHAVVTPDDKIAIVWEDARNDNPKIYAQLIAANGDRLWGDSGMELTDVDPLRQKGARISYSYFDDSFYIGWSGSVQVESNFYFHVFGQRIVNNQKMWGADGRLISVLPTGSENSECTLYSLNDSYYMWHRYSSDNTQTIWVKRVDSNGDAYAGWDNEGHKASTYNDWDTFQILPVAHLTPSGLFVMWKDMRGDFIPNYWGQHFGPSGVREWDPLGVNLADRQNEQERPVVTSSQSGVTFAWCENLNGVHDIAIHKYALNGSPLWGNLGYYVVQKDSTQSNPTMADFSNGVQVVAWTDFYSIESDIYYKYVNQDGTMIGDPMGWVVTNASKPQYDPMAAVLNNEAYVVWADGRSSGKTEILGLYAQKLNNPVANDDPSAPPVGGITLDQNFPNPFNPHTKISFSLARAAEGLKLEIFNLKGQLVKELHRGDLPAGKHSFSWDGKDSHDMGVASGMYFYKLSGDNFSLQKKMILMK